MSKATSRKTVLPPESLRAKRATAAAAGQERKKIYIVDKKILLEKEKDNYTKLMLLKCPDGWWKIFGLDNFTASRYNGGKFCDGSIRYDMEK